MKNNVLNPLVIRCNSCGGDQSFDIIKQKYICAHCGTETDLAEKKTQYRQWKSLRHQANMKDVSGVKTFACPSCGARTMAMGEDASARCPFCQNTMIDDKFAGTDLPEVIIPFKITKEEAESKLKEWLRSNKSNPAAKAIEKNMHRFTGCYLPYHIVRGAYNGEMIIRLQDGSSSDYPFKAYLNHTIVNASKDLDNLFLDGIEPFDFDEAREFEFGFLNHQNAKIQNVENDMLRTRIHAETSSELQESLTPKVHTKEFFVTLDDDDNESIPALMPVYLVKCKNGIAAAVNGQTGKVSIATGKQKNLTGKWWLWPTIAALIVGVIGAIWGGLELGIAGGAVFGIIFFVVAHNRHDKNVVDEIITRPKTKKSHNDTRTVFFADFGKGPVPAELKFFTPWRITKFVLILLAIIFLPVIIAIPIQLIRGWPLSDIRIGYAAVWFCIPVIMSIVFAGGLAKAMMYGFPLYYEILPNGKRARRKASQEGKFSLKRYLAITKRSKATESKPLRSLGCLLVGFFLILLIGSIAAMLS